MHEVSQRVLHVLLKFSLAPLHSPTPSLHKNRFLFHHKLPQIFFILQFKEPHNPFFHVLILLASIIRACKCQYFNKNRFKFKW